ncbi:MAG: hypothetical protein GX638_12190 [Crenarchaeota archaeon]|nr:hypothetical protein [Thermoproteota archaeon]
MITKTIRAETNLIENPSSNTYTLENPTCSASHNENGAPLDKINDVEAETKAVTVELATAKTEGD